MPYVNYLFCERCGFPARLDLNYIKTIEAYNLDGRSSSTLDDRLVIWDYIIYSCAYCQKDYKYTYQDVERRVREFFAASAKRNADLIEEVARAQETDEARRSGAYFVSAKKKLAERVNKMYSK